MFDTTDELLRQIRLGEDSFQQRSQARLIRFDEQTVTTAPESALSKRLWDKFRTPLSPPGDEEFLLKLKLLSKDEDGVLAPTVSGVLMATENPHEFLANAYIQAVAYRGTERNAAHQLDARDITGPLDAQIADACKFVERNMRIGAVGLGITSVVVVAIIPICTVGYTLSVKNAAALFVHFHKFRGRHYFGTL